jgi:mRNA interferase HigB
MEEYYQAVMLCQYQMVKIFQLSIVRRGKPGGVALVPKWDYSSPMKVIAISTLRTFWTAHPQAEHPLKAWYDEAKKASWKTPAEIKAHYRSASFVANNRVIFNIKGNDYRLVVAIAYNGGIIFIKFIGTHEEYDSIDAATVEPEL